MSLGSDAGPRGQRVAGAGRDWGGVRTWGGAGVRGGAGRLAGSGRREGWGVDPAPWDVTPQRGQDRPWSRPVGWGEEEGESLSEVTLDGRCDLMASGDCPQAVTFLRAVPPWGESILDVTSSLGSHCFSLMLLLPQGGLQGHLRTPETQALPRSSPPPAGSSVAPGGGPSSRGRLASRSGLRALSSTVTCLTWSASRRRATSPQRRMCYAAACPPRASMSTASLCRKPTCGECPARLAWGRLVSQGQRRWGHNREVRVSWS